MTEMIRILICTLLISLGLGATAQDSFFAKDKVWISNMFVGGFADEMTHSVPTKWAVSADTVIDGKNCKIMRTGFEVNGHEDIRQVIMHEQDGVVSYLGRNFDWETETYSTQFKPLMNFNAKVGERLSCYLNDESTEYEDAFIVKEIVTMSVEGIDRKVIRISSTYRPEEICMEWIEGIGSVTREYLTQFPVHTWPKHLNKQDAYLQEVYQDGKLIFSLKNWLKQSALPLQNFFEKDKVWITEEFIPRDNTDWQAHPVKVKWYVEGDTILDRQLCSILKSELVDTGEKLGKCILHEYNGDILLPYAYYWDYSGTPMLSYNVVPVINFSVKPNDHLDLYTSDGAVASADFFTVKEIKTESIEGTDRKVIYLDTRNGHTDNVAVWIDGIGALGNMYMIEREMPDGIGATQEAVYTGLTEVWQGDKLIFSRENWEQQMSGVRAVKAEPAVDADAPVYDLQGRQVKQPRQGQIYIHSGKKIIR